MNVEAYGGRGARRRQETEIRIMSQPQYIIVKRELWEDITRWLNGDGVIEDRSPRADDDRLKCDMTAAQSKPEQICMWEELKKRGEL